MGLWIWAIVVVAVLCGLYLLTWVVSLTKIKLVALIAILALIIFTFSQVSKSNEISLNSLSGIARTTYLSLGFMGRSIIYLWGVGSETVTIVGNAIKTNTPQNTSNQE